MDTGPGPLLGCFFFLMMEVQNRNYGQSYNFPDVARIGYGIPRRSYAERRLAPC